MAKPHWVDAPEWAQWLGQDADGQWWWHEFRPKPESFTERGEPEFWHSVNSQYDWARSTPVKGDWKETLEHRP
jgi:hypothetical protein